MLETTSWNARGSIGRTSPDFPGNVHADARGHRHSSAWFRMQDGRVLLPDVSITGSSEAILQGQKPPFRLLARAVSTQDGSRASYIRPAVSVPFVVRVSPRSPAVPAYYCIRVAGIREECRPGTCLSPVVRPQSHLMLTSIRPTLVLPPVAIEQEQDDGLSLKESCSHRLAGLCGQIVRHLSKKSCLPRFRAVRRAAACEPPVGKADSATAQYYQGPAGNGLRDQSYA